MALDLYIYSEGNNAEQITDLCELLAGGPKLNRYRGSGLPPENDAELRETPAYIWLNDILQGNYVDQEWPFLDSAASVTVSAGHPEVALPCNFLRMQFDDGLILLGSHNARTPLRHLDPRVFFQRQLGGSPGMPVSFMIDKMRSVIVVDPVPDKDYIGELHYRFYIPRLTARTDVPFFPHKDYLQKQLLVLYYQHQNDSRYDRAAQDAGAAYAKIRTQAYDSKDAEDSIPLDTTYYPNVDDWDD